MQKELTILSIFEKKPVGEINFRTIRIGCNMALDTGNYTFTFEDKNKFQHAIVSLMSGMERIGKYHPIIHL